MFKYRILRWFIDAVLIFTIILFGIDGGLPDWELIIFLLLLVTLSAIGNTLLEIGAEKFGKGEL